MVGPVGVGWVEVDVDETDEMDVLVEVETVELVVETPPDDTELLEDDESVTGMLLDEEDDIAAFFW